YFASFSSRTVVYKGMLTPAQLPEFYLDLCDPRYTTRVAVVHNRFSTNTTPTWERAQPLRRICHNGEINTLQGNIHWMRAREALLPEALRPVIDTRGSDSAMLDNALELLVLGSEERRSLPRALTMLMPPAWEENEGLPSQERAFYAHNATMQEPWDGPAGVCFTDGLVLGATLDRNGLRPLRYDVTHNGWLIIASEAGAAGLEPHEIAHHGRLGPGQMIAADVEEGYWVANDALKERLATLTIFEEPPYVAVGSKHVDEREARGWELAEQSETLKRLQGAFGYTSEELQVVLKPMVRDAKEAIGSMGDDTPHAVYSEKPRPLAHYFKQRFAEVTNPAIDPLRERLMMSLRCHLGPLPNPLDPTSAADRIVLASPLVSPAQLNEIRETGLRVVHLDATFHMDERLETGVKALFQAAEAAIDEGAQVLIVSDRAVSEERILIPSLLAVGGLHHHLLRRGLRARVSLVAESGEARDPHSIATLLGYGANAVCPWLALASAVAIGAEPYRGEIVESPNAVRRFLKAAEDGVLKIMSKMGIGPVESYCGAQLFETLGLSDEVIDRYFFGTPNRIGGVGLAALEAEVRRWHGTAWQSDEGLDSPGFYKYKRGGEHHAFSPPVVHALQKAVRTEGALNGQFEQGYEAYRQYVNLLEGGPPSEPRDLLRLVERPEQATSSEQVEPITAIFRRFSTAAMSLGSLGREAHETLAVAMSRLGGMSNSGEGGEDPARFNTEGNSTIKQVASGRFGVTPAYLMSARELQIKIAQGSKPGEGGQLPGKKVTVEIAALRHTMPGVTLISPPPHHDIYSIEDLAQLIYDLRAINPAARISVKLVCQPGVGVIAAGVVKAGADVVHLSGHSGGTGASPLSSIKHAGEPWEVGLAETQQMLVEQRLRDRVILRVDGGLRSGRDVIVAAILGADEFSFGTAALVAEGCLMARACHKNTCPVGIATQRPELRAKFDATPEQVMAFFTFVAEEVREYLARLGATTIDEIVGQTHLLEAMKDERWGTDLTALLRQPALSGARHHDRRYHRPFDEPTLDDEILRDVQHDLNGTARCRRHYRITNQDRAIGARLAGYIAKKQGDTRLREGTIHLSFTGYAGQSFGAWALPGTVLTLHGVANDYVGKGLGGGTLVLMRPEGASWDESAPLLGNVALYGATAGKLFASGSAGERFAIRNGGATAVVEGVGAHGCEYMTGGTVVVLGPTGRNFAAGMTGGRAFVYDPDDRLAANLNDEFVEIVPPSIEQLAEIHELVRSHTHHTGSARGRRLLAAWEAHQSAWNAVLQKNRHEHEALSQSERAQPLARAR
ncbi:MAG: glutamate synthase large subunit, partial [Chloroflexota bacterium]|nr:glutamate synthase large subunit [Chloroflexota bacterium]